MIFLAGLRSLQGMRRSLLLIALGGLCGWFFSPYNYWAVSLLSFPLFLFLSENTKGRSAFACGWAFGFGYFLLGLYWISNAMLVDIGDLWWMYPFAMAGLPALLALFWGAALWGLQKLGTQGLKRALLFTVIFALTEWLRGHLLTGLPWLMLGYLWVDVEVVRSMAAVAGIYGLTQWALLLAALPYAFIQSASKRERVAVLALALLWTLLPVASAHYVGLLPVQSVETLKIRLIQPNVEQSMKFNPASREANFARLLEMTAKPGDYQVALWPESATSYLLDERPDLRARIAQALPTGGYLVSGVVHRDGFGAFYNSVQVFDSHAATRATYDKQHLVPFGEFIPFHEYLPLPAIAAGINFSAGPGPKTLLVDAVPGFSPLVCYDVIFPGRISGIPNPQWLLNVTNDAWYGNSHGPYQHLDISRLRAVEEGRPLVRVANSGISAVISIKGNIEAKIPLSTAGLEDYRLGIQTIDTPYAQYGDLMFAIFTILLLSFTLALARKWAL